MPIDISKYPYEWSKISIEVRKKAKNTCELCGAKNYKPHWKTGSKVILTVHHIDGDTKNNSYYNLIALCQRCHLRLDAQKHFGNRNGSVKGSKNYWVEIIKKMLPIKFKT